MKKPPLCVHRRTGGKRPGDERDPCLVDHVIRPEETDTLFRACASRCSTPPATPWTTSATSPRTTSATSATPSCAAARSTPPACPTPSASARVWRPSKLKDSLTDCEALAVAHCGVLYDHFDDLVDENLRIMEDQLSEVKALVDHPMSSDEVCAAVCAHGRQRVHPEEGPEPGTLPAPLSGFMVDEGQPPHGHAGALPCAMSLWTEFKSNDDSSAPGNRRGAAPSAGMTNWGCKGCQRLPLGVAFRAALTACRSDVGRVLAPAADGRSYCNGTAYRSSVKIGIPFTIAFLQICHHGTAGQAPALHHNR